MPPETRAKMVALARRAIEGKVVPQEGASIEVERRGDVYVVTFTHVTPPDSLGPDFDAQVTIDASTHRVLGVLGGP
jgi:hypothetical protein